MTSTIYTYNLDGPVKFPVGFEYLARRFVKVTLVGTERRELKLNVDYRFTSKMEIETTLQWGPAQGFTGIEIRRVTSAQERLVVFTDGSILRSLDLNIAQIQAIHIAEEGRDVAHYSMLNDSLSWDALNLRIRNVAEPIFARDVATKGYVDILQEFALARVMKAPIGENLKTLPSASLRANKILGFDSEGNPVGTLPMSGSGTELAMDLADPSKGTAIVSYRNALSQSHYRTLKERLSDTISAKDFGVKGDGVTNDSVACQNLIDLLSEMGGGCIIFPRGKYKLNIVIKKYVSLVGGSYGASRGMGVSGANINRWMTTFIAAGPGWVVDSVEERGDGTGINGIDFIGLGASVDGGGVYLRKGNTNAIVRCCMFSGFSNEALWSEALVGRFSDLMSTNCLLRRIRTARTGAFRIEGADNYIERVEGNTGISGIVSVERNLCGIYIGGANNYALSLMGELSEIGIFTIAEGAPHKIVNSRADLNYGPGYEGGGAMLSNCHAHNNSNGQPGVYSGFVAGAGVQYSGCRASGKHKYGADFSGADYADLAYRPNVDNFVSTGHVTAEILYPASNGIVIGLRAAHLRNVTATGVISVSGGINSIRFSHTTDGEITGLSGEHMGQMVTVVATSSSSILVRGANFIVHGVDGNGKKRMASGRAYTFVRGQTSWVETTDNNVIPLVDTRPNLYSTPGMMVFDKVLKKLIIRNEANTGWHDTNGVSV